MTPVRTFEEFESSTVTVLKSPNSPRLSFISSIFTVAPYLIPILILPSKCSSNSSDAIAKRTSEEVLFLSKCEVIDQVGITGSAWSEMDCTRPMRSYSKNNIPTPSPGLNFRQHVDNLGGQLDRWSLLASFVAEDAASLLLGEYARYGWNEYHSLNCYKDDGRINYPP